MKNKWLIRLTKPSTLVAGAVIIVFLFGLYFALAGVDFGTQWDQNNIKGFVNKFIRTGNILPGEYHYPPGSSYIATMTVVPYALPFVQRYGLNWTPTQRYLLDEVLKNPNQGFLLNLRRVFVVVTMLGVLWTGAATAQKDKVAGVIAAAALAFSWEVSYQSRIVHPDGPAMQFVALTILFCMLAFYNKKPFDFRIWFGLAAIAAAAATATKYTAGISIFIVLILAYTKLTEQKGLRTGKRLLTLGLLALIFVIAFVILVPGVILEAPIFFYQVVRDQEIYAAGHGLQTVNAGWDYLQRILSYLFQAGFSHNRILAFFFPTLAVAGTYSLIKSRDRRQIGLALALAGIPALYILFLATHRVLFVRNLLVIFPSLAILSGFGFAWLMTRMRSLPIWRAVLVGILLLVLVVNGWWIGYTARTIQERGTVAAEQALAAIRQRSDQAVFITPAAQRLLGDLALPQNAVLQFDDSTDLVLFAFRGDTYDEEEGAWPVNFPSASPIIFGPMEINMDWYASWPGVERLVLSSVSLARQDGARLVPASAIPRISSQLTQEVSGTLVIDGDQFYVQLGETRIYILNSANPELIMALRPFLNKQVSVAGRPYSDERLDDWYLISVNGIALFGEEELKTEFNFTRFYSYLSEGQRNCLGAALGIEMYRAIVDTSINLVDLPDEDLQSVVDCTN